MKCNYKPSKLTKEEQQEMASIKTTLPYIDRMQIKQRQKCEAIYNDEERECPECRYFVGCEAACGGRVCDMFVEAK